MGAAVVSTVALGGVQIGPSAPNAQVGEYISPDVTGGGEGPAGQAGSAAPSADVGSGGELAFTGLVLLPMVMVAVVLILGAVALRRIREDAGDAPVPA